jgi:hypothetical protein
MEKFMNIEECELRGIYDNDKKTLHIFHEGTHVASLNIPHSSQESLTLDCKRDELRLREEEEALHKAEIDRQIEALREEKMLFRAELDEFLAGIDCNPKKGR